MHEVGLMSNVLEMVRESARQRNITRIYKVKLVIGKMAMALPDSLQLAFEVLSQDELFKGSVLEIEEKEIQCRCSACQNRFTIDREYRFTCPRCGGNRTDIVSGRELFIDYYEGD